MHSVYSSQTVTTFMGAHAPDTGYIAPQVSVPTTVMGYTGHSSWNEPAGSHNCAGHSGRQADASSSSGGDPSRRPEREEEFLAKHIALGLSVQGLVLAVYIF